MTDQRAALALDIQFEMTHFDNLRDEFPASEFPIYRMIRDIHTIAARELAYALSTHTPYYFSDSTYDAISQYSHMIATCAALNDFFYETPLADAIALIPDLLDDIDSLLDFPFDDDAFRPADSLSSPTFAAIAAAIHESL